MAKKHDQAKFEATCALLHRDTASLTDQEAIDLLCMINNGIRWEDVYAEDGPEVANEARAYIAAHKALMKRT